MSKADQSDVDHLIERDEREENRYRFMVLKYIQDLLVSMAFLVKLTKEGV